MSLDNVILDDITWVISDDPKYLTNEADTSDLNMSNIIFYDNEAKGIPLTVYLPFDYSEKIILFPRRTKLEIRGITIEDILESVYQYYTKTDLGDNPEIMKLLREALAKEISILDKKGNSDSNFLTTRIGTSTRVSTNTGTSTNTNMEYYTPEEDISLWSSIVERVNRKESVPPIELLGDNIYFGGIYCYENECSLLLNSR